MIGFDFFFLLDFDIAVADEGTMPLHVRYVPTYISVHVERTRGVRMCATQCLILGSLIIDDRLSIIDCRLVDIK